MNRKKQRRCFFISFFMTLLLCLFMTGCVIADSNTRKIGFGEESEVVSFSQKENDPGGMTVNIFNKKFTVGFNVWQWLGYYLNLAI